MGKNLSLQTVLEILYYKIQNKPVPVELTADSYVIYHTFTRHWEYFKAVYSFMNGDQYFSINIPSPWMMNRWIQKPLIQEISEF